MILLDGFFEGILVLVVAILGIYVVKYLVGLLMSGTSQLTGKTFVHRGQVWSEPEKPVYNQDILPLKTQQTVEKLVKDKYAEENKKVVAELKSKKVDLLSQYNHSTKLTNVPRNSHNNNDEKRAELIQTLVECGIAKEDAFVKALEKYPIGT